MHALQAVQRILLQPILWPRQEAAFEDYFTDWPNIIFAQFSTLFPPHIRLVWFWWSDSPSKKYWYKWNDCGEHPGRRDHGKSRPDQELIIFHLEQDLITFKWNAKEQVTECSCSGGSRTASQWQSSDLGWCNKGAECSPGRINFRHILRSGWKNHFLCALVATHCLLLIMC